MSAIKRYLEDQAELVAKNVGISWDDAMIVWEQGSPATIEEWTMKALKFKRERNKNVQ